MITTLKNLVRAALPAPLHRALTRRRRLHFTGPYRNWSAARAAAGGYDDPAILERMVASAREVAAGRAAYERDTVLFHEPAADPLLLGELETLALSRPRGLRVLDFGGALGSTWFQHRAFLRKLPPVSWHIVEQPKIAARGRLEFSGSGLTFHDSLDSALDQGPPDLVLISSVLQYLPDPWSALARLSALPAETWLITRTPFTDTLATDTIVVQHVPAAIYRASYSAWVFSTAAFEDFWTRRSASLTWHPCTGGRFTDAGVIQSYRTARIRSAPGDNFSSPSSPTPRIKLPIVIPC